MKRLPIITSVESKLRFPVKETREGSEETILSYREAIDTHKNQVQFFEEYEPMVTTSCIVALSGYVQIGFSSAENGRMYILKVPLKTSFFSTYIQGSTGCLKMAMAVSLN